MTQVTQELLDHIATQNAASREWQDAAPGRWAGMLVEDAGWWAERGIFTVEDYDRWTMESTMSDLHKEAYGFRPRGYDFAAMPLDELIDLYDEWSVAAKQAYEQERAHQDAAVAEFEAELTNLIDMGAGDRETALRWYLDGLGLDEYEMQDAGFVCYRLDLPYSMEKEFQPILAEMRDAAQEVA
jgi:hypothetical protein